MTLAWKVHDMDPNIYLSHTRLDIAFTMRII